MKACRLAAFYALLVLAAAGLSAQDTTCENFETDEIACNDPPSNACSSHASLSGVIELDNGSGCNHLIVQALICPSSSSCAPSSYPEVSVPNPYCAALCGCGGDCGGDGSGGTGGCGSQDFGKPCTKGGGGGGGGTSPIVVDTTGRGFHLTSAEEGVTFDIRGDGHPIKLAWTTANSGNAFLALDRNHNGKIDGVGSCSAISRTSHRRLTRMAT